MIFEIRYRISDTCGNSDTYHVGYCEFKNKSEAEKTFPPGFLGGYDVVEVFTSTPGALKAKADKALKEGRYY